MPRYFLPNVRFAPAADIVAKVAFFGDERKFPEPLMRFARGDVRTVSFHPKSITDLRGGGTFAVRQSQLIRKQKATRALHRMAFARLHTPGPSRDSVSGRMVCGWRCLSRV
jgi:hypothetical protein